MRTPTTCRPTTARGRMINRIVDLSVEHRLVIFLLPAALCVGGWWSMRHLPLDAILDAQYALRRAWIASRTRAAI